MSGLSREEREDCVYERNACHRLARTHDRLGNTALAATLRHIADNWQARLDQNDMTAEAPEP